MKYTVKISKLELEHDDLVDLFSTALYGQDIFECDYGDDELSEKIMNEYRAKYASENNGEKPCYEDVLAELILKGGCIYVSDFEQAVSNKDDLSCPSKSPDCLESYAVIERDAWWPAHDGDKLYVPVYRLDNERITKMIEKALSGDNKEAEEHARQLFEIASDANPDLYDGLGVLEYILYGEVIYG